ncbi:MAG TPA: hypothetical protein VHM65_08110, partial [Candidatus Lustribacter sp.]|nr:hypothetical protein [Candidatus Lustribacter sp.]
MAHDRSILGTADITDDQLAGVVAEEHGVDPGAVTVIQSTAEEVPYDLESMTTAGRYWVHGTARVDDSEMPFRYFVKHVQSWSRSPLFRFVPEPFQAQAEAGVPWRTEPLGQVGPVDQRLGAPGDAGLGLGLERLR